MPCLLDKNAAVRVNEPLLYKAAAIVADWDEVAAAHMLKVPADHPARFAQEMAADCQAGRSFCVRGLVDGQRVATGVVRMDGALAFIQAGFVSPDAPPGVFWDVFLPDIEAECRRRGARIIATATARPGLVAAYRKHGWGVHLVEVSKKL